MADGLSAAIDEIVEAELKICGTGAAVAVMRDGALVHHRGYGLANLELGVAAEPDTVFPICSISKPITATLAMMLVAEGRLDLDAPVRRYLPAFDPARDAITLRHLLTHTSGLRNYNASDRFQRHEGQLTLPSAERLVYLLAEPAEFAPGERYAYCNTGYVLMGFIIEAATGQRFQQVLNERVFGPCGMAQSLLLTDHAIIPKRASGYEMGPRGLVKAWRSAPSWRGGAGGIASTVGDLARWIQALDEGRLVDAATFSEMLKPVVLNDGSSFDYGLGWGVGSYRGLRGYLHTGGGFGYAGELVRFPDHGLTIILLTNLYRFPFHRVGLAIAREALGLASEATTPRPAPKAAACAGLWRNRDGAEFQLAATADEVPGLVHRGGHVFHAADDPETLYRFLEPGADGFHALTVETPLFPPAIYRRVTA